MKTALNAIGQTPPACWEGMSGVTVVSDGGFTCGSAPMSEFSSDGTRIFCGYLTSRAGYGEAHDIVALVEIPVTDPAAAKNHVVFQAGETLCGVMADRVDSFDVFLRDGKVRCVFGVNEERIGWRDWDPDAGGICGEGLFKCRVAGGAQAEELTPAVLTRHLDSKGFVGHNVTRERCDRLVIHSHACRVDGAFYGTLTSSLSQPIAFRCGDGETLEFQGVVPSLCEYECALAHLNGRFYALGRKMKGDNFFVSDDGCRTFRPAGRLPDGEQRPELTVRNGRLLIA